MYVERPHTGPLSPAHLDPHGRPPLPDGHLVHRPPAPPPVRRVRRVVLVCVALVLVLMAAGIAGWWQR